MQGRCEYVCGSGGAAVLCVHASEESRSKFLLLDVLLEGAELPGAVTSHPVLVFANVLLTQD